MLRAWMFVGTLVLILTLIVLAAAGVPFNGLVVIPCLLWVAALVVVAVVTGRAERS